MEVHIFPIEPAEISTDNGAGAQQNQQNDLCIPAKAQIHTLWYWVQKFTTEHVCVKTAFENVVKYCVHLASEYGFLQRYLAIFPSNYVQATLFISKSRGPDKILRVISSFR